MYAITAYGPNEISKDIYYSQDKQKLIDLLKDAFPEEELIIHKWSMREGIRTSKYERTDENQERWDKLLDSYYFGCGGISYLEIREIKEDTVFANWDLD